MKVNYKDSLYHERRHSDLLDDDDLRRAWGHFAKLAYFDNLDRKSSILEYGAGLGNNLLALPSNFEVYAYEPSSKGVEIARRDGIVAFENISDVPLKSFDMILCRHVLEHVHQPKSTLEEMRDMLNPGGVLTLVLPVDSQEQKPRENEKDFHLYCWNPRTIYNLLQICGYDEISYHYEYFGARRKLLPIYRRFGGTAYARAVRATGRVFKFRELVVRARKQASYMPEA